MDKATFNKIVKYGRGLSFSILDEIVPIYDGSAIMPDEIGWCTEKGVYLNYTHPMINKLPIKEQIAFLIGVLVHELMHKAYSDFEVLKYGLEKYKGDKIMQSLVGQISNIVEDPAIEYMSRFCIGGYARKCLLFTIHKIYSETEPLSSSDKSAFQQLMKAYIQFGDVGLIKGEFTFPEAKNIFGETVDIFDKAIMSTSAKERFVLSEEIALKVRQIIDEDAFNDDMDDLNNQRASNGRGGIPQGSGSAKKSVDEEDEEEDGDSTGSSKKAINKKATKQKYGKGGASSDSESEDKAIAEEDGETKEDKDAVTDTEEAKSNSPEDGEDADDSEDGEASDNDNGRQKVSSESFDYTSGEVSDKSNNGLAEDEVTEDIYDLTDDDINAIVEEVKKTCEIIDQQETARANSVASTKDEEVSIPVEQYPNVRVQNKVIKPCLSLASEYATLRDRLNPQIMQLIRSLQRIFRQDKEEKLYTSSGKFSTRRFTSGKQTTRVFTRNREPKDKANMKVCVLVDESGSMSGQSKSLYAKMTTIVLAEAFDKLDIPLSVIGFTTDMERYDVNQHHYLHWNNKLGNRYSLLNIGAYNCNFDGYSVRYAIKMMKQKRTAHDILIVVSDGEPSEGLSSRNARFADLADAVAEAKKSMSVIGIGLGDINTKNFEQFYGDDFVNIRNISDLPQEVTNLVRGIVKKW